jgi:hypothetical protein
MNDLQDDLNLGGMMDGNHRGVLVGRYNCALDDRNSVVMTDGNLCHRTNGRPDDLNLDDVRHGLTMGDDLMTDVSLDLRKSDLLVDRNLDDVRRDRKMALMTDVNLCHRMSDQLDDLMTGVSRVNHKYVRRDPNLVVKMGGMRHRVKLMVYLNRSCDRMSHDHLQYDRLLMRHRDTNRMDGKNLDGKMKIHHANHRMKVYRMRLHRENRLMTVCLKKI